MTNVLAIHSVGESLRTYLDNAYHADARNKQPCDFKLISGGELEDKDASDNAISLLLYRVTMNEHFRGVRRMTNATQETTPLSVNLHYLVTTWAKSAVIEHTNLAWTMLQLQQHPVLDRSALSTDANWGPGEFVQIIPEELSTEDLMRIWDALEPKYRLSVSYVARVVRIDGDALPEGLPVVASRFSFVNTSLP